jgi:ketosteroid isomerase-like protein
MVTIGRGLLDPAVHELFEGLRSYDPPRAAKVLAEDADWDSAWSNGKITGRVAIEQFLAGWIKDAKKRPSFSIIDVDGDGAVTRLHLSVSGRFGQAPEHVVMHVLCLKHVVHQVKVVPEAKKGGH